MLRITAVFTNVWSMGHAVVALDFWSCLSTQKAVGSLLLAVAVTATPVPLLRERTHTRQHGPARLLRHCRCRLEQKCCPAWYSTAHIHLEHGRLCCGMGIYFSKLETQQAPLFDCRWLSVAATVSTDGTAIPAAVSTGAVCS